MTKAERTRQMIIEKAATLFNERGIAGTSMDEILRAADVAKGCLYNHFENKEELANACIDYMIGRIWQILDEGYKKSTTAKGKLLFFLEANKNPLTSINKGGCPIINFATESDDADPKIRKKIKQVVEKAIAHLAAIIKEAMANGEISRKVDAEELATRMFVSVEGANGLCRVLNSPQPMKIVINNLKAELDAVSC